MIVLLAEKLQLASGEPRPGAPKTKPSPISTVFHYIFATSYRHCMSIALCNARAYATFYAYITLQHSCTIAFLESMDSIVQHSSIYSIDSHFYNLSCSTNIDHYQRIRSLAYHHPSGTNSQHPQDQLEMCIRYHIEFWMACKATDADWERKVRRGLARPGINPDATKIRFFECKGRFHKSVQCTATNVDEGGVYGNRILDFCEEDDDCFLRLKTLEAQNTEDERIAKQAERERWPTSDQAEATRYWKKSYDDWTSAYDNHRDCPYRRSQSKLWAELKRAGVVKDNFSIPDDQRLGAHPGTAEEPISGMPRQYDAPERRY